MNNEQNSDRLDELFRRHLDGYAEDPPEEVWQNVRPKLPQNRRRGGWFLPTSGALLLLATLAACVIFWENRQEKRLQILEEQLAMQPEPAQNADDLEAKKPENSPTDNASASKVEASQSVGNQPLTPSKANIFSTKKAMSANRTTSTDSAPTPLAREDFLEKQASPSDLFTARKLAATDSLLAQKLPVPDSFHVKQLPAPHLSADAIGAKNTSSFSATGKLLVPIWQPILFEKNATPPYVKTGLELPSAKFRPTIEVYFNRAFALSINHLAKTNPEITPDLGYRWNAGALVELAASRRWSLLTGFDYGVLAPIAYDEKAFNWSETTAVVLTDGSVVNNLSFEVATALGTTFFQAQVKKNADNVTHGEAYELRVVTQPEVAISTIPFVVKFYLNRQRFSTFLKAGIGLSQVRSREVNLLKINAQNSDKWSVLKTEQGVEVLLDLQKYFWQTHLGFGAAYRLNKHFSVLAEPTFSLSLSPLENRSEPKLRPKSLGLQVAGRVDF